MSQTVKVNGKKIKLQDSDFLSSGGEAEVYVKDAVAYKIYHKPEKMISEQKMKELSTLHSRSNIITPDKPLYDNKSNPIGFTMSFKPDTEPLCKLFTNSFKNKNGVTTESVNTVIEKMQETIDFIHGKNILVVDLNELNILVPRTYDDSYFIDVDSYQTPSHRATAIMTSIKDPLVSNNHWTDGSDWFSFAILAFQMWIGIHPYKGRHPNYKPKEWLKRMEDGVSIFDPSVKIPRMCNDFSTIPPSHYEWLKAVFTQNERSTPPKLGDVSALIISSLNIIQSSQDFETELFFTARQDIQEYFDVMGVKYFISQDGVYKDTAKLSVDLSNSRKALIASTTGVTPVIARLSGDMAEFFNTKGSKFGEVSAKNMMAMHGCIYTINGQDLYSHNFEVRGVRDVVWTKMVCGVRETAVRMFDGVLFQPMFKKQHAIIPYDKNNCSIIHLEELDESRIVEAKYERGICVVLCEKNGVYNRHIFTFNMTCTEYTHRYDEDVSYSEVNFTVMPNGVTILATNDDVEVFKGNGVKKIDNPPFNASTKLLNRQGTVYYIDGKEVHRTTIKK
jgi:hypothetical protein